MAQKPTLFVKASSIACELSVGAHTAVAGNDDADGIAAHSTADGLCGHIGCYFPGNISVGSAFSVGDLKQDIPHLFLEICTAGGKVEGVCSWAFSPEIGIQPILCPVEYGQVILFH